MSGAASHYNLAIIITEQRRGQAIRSLQQDVTKATQRIDNFQGGATRAATATDKWRERAGRLGTKLKNVMVPAILLASAAATAFVKDSVGEFAQFDQKMHETFTLMPDTSDSFREGMMDDLRQVGESMGMLSDETLPGLYQALSAGIPEGNAVEAVALASKAAIAGASDLESTMRLGAAIVNAYGGEVYDLGQAYDIMFQLIDKGVPRMTDWTASMQNVTSIASESRVPFEDVAAALAIMTQQGDSAGESTELLGFLLMQLSISGTGAAKAFAEAAGMSFRKWIELGGGLVDGLVLMENHAKSTGQELGDMIGGDSKFYRDQQAARASLELTGVHLLDLVNMRKEFNEESIEGLNEQAFTEASDNAQFELDKMGAAWETVKIEIGKAIWEQEIFLGKSGEQMVEYAANFARLISRSWLDLDISARQQPLDTMDQLIAKNEELMDVRFKMLALGVYDEWQAEWESNIMRIGEVSTNYKEFYETLRKIGALKGEAPYEIFGDEFYEVGGEKQLNDSVRGLERRSALLYEAIKTNQMMARTAKEAFAHEAIMNEQREQGAHRYRMTQESANALLLNFVDMQEQATAAQARTTETFLDMSLLYGQLSYDVADFKDNPVWEPIRVTPIDSMVLDSFEKQKDNYIALYDAEQQLQENGGDWRDFIVNNEGQIAAEMEKLTQDITDVEKDAMWEIVRTAEEGGAEWLDAWSALQTDLTEVQRAETVKRLADLTDANGEMGKSWDGNKDDALGAAEDIIQALKDIQAEHDNLVLATARSQFIKRFGEDSVEMQLAYLALQVEMGKVEEGAAPALASELQFASNLERVTRIMTEGFLSGDGELTSEEIENIGKAGDISKGQIQNLTDQGVQAFLNIALSESGGFPYVGQTIKKEVEDPTREAQREMMNMVREGPYTPEFEIDKKAFDTTYGEMTRLISNALGPHKVQFYGVYSGYQPPEGESNDDEYQGPGHASGIRGGVVPSGYPNDSYLVRMSSGEGYNVYRRGEQQPQQNNGGGGGDTYNTVINNHTRAAASVAVSQIQTLTRKRINSFMGE